jgi:hypothetical protein
LIEHVGGGFISISNHVGGATTSCVIEHKLYTKIIVSLVNIVDMIVYDKQNIKLPKQLILALGLVCINSALPEEVIYELSKHLKVN